MPKHIWFAASCAFIAIVVDASAAPVVDAEYASRLAITASRSGAGAITQMAWGPNGRLYAARSSGGVVSFQYDAATGQLSEPQPAAALDATGIGFVPSRGEMYLAGFDSLWRLTDADGDGTWGEADVDARVAIVTNIPTGFHPTGQVQISGNTLYLGIGIRGSDGGTGTWPDAPEGESALSGTICWIQDVSQVPSTTDAARLLGPINTNTIQNDASPYTSTAVNKLIVHSAGARNPFGLAFDRVGNLYFTNNYNRADTHGDGTSSASGPNDAAATDLTRSVHDQFFKAAVNADYGFRNDNWRGLRSPAVQAAILDPANPNHLAVHSITPDNLRTTDSNYLQLHDSAYPVGLGPSSSADGFAFWNHPALPTELFGAAFVTRWNPQISESAPGTHSIAYSDLVAVDSQTGTVRRIAHGFVNPLAVLADKRGHLLVADWGAEAVFTLTVLPPPDADGDGVPDFWTLQYFGHPTGQASDKSLAGDDADGDGTNNHLEFLAGTDPRNAASVMRVQNVGHSGSDIVLSFSSIDSRRYRFELSPDLSPDSWITLSDNIEGTGGIVQIIDPNALSQPRRFYRLLALPLY